MTQRKSHVLGRERYELTPRQREVLERIAAGKTNFEIAQELGIGLEGVKHHVSEILGRLGVDSREQAADWWREQQRWHRRLLGLMSTGWAKWTAAGSAVAVVGAVAVFLFATRSAEPPTTGGLPPGTWLLLGGPSFTDDGELRPPARLRAINYETGEDVQFGEPARYALARWAPDGSAAAAAVIGDTGTELVIAHVDGRATITRALGPTQPLGPVQSIAWSPDGGRIMVEFPAVLVMLDSSGNELGRLPLGSEGSIPDWYQRGWSPDSSLYATARPDRLTVANRSDLSGSTYKAGDFIGDSSDLRGMTIAGIAGWEDASTLRVFLRTDSPDQDPSVGIRVRFNGATNARGEQMSITEPPPPEVLEEHVRDNNAVAVLLAPTADGAGAVYTIHIGAEPPAGVAWLAVVRDDRLVTIHLPRGYGADPPSLAANDVVIIP